MTTLRAPAPTDVLNVNGVEVVIDSRVILHDVDFRVGAGEFTGLIGSNGSGKTTLFRVILGLQPTRKGTVTLRGEPLAQRNRSIGYVPQKVLFDSETPLRARDLVALGVDGHRYGLRRRSRAELSDIDEMLSAVDAERFADRRVGELSGGEQQRVLIAHALVSRPELLLLDEPLANLDPGSAEEIIGLLHRVATAHQVAVLMSSHEINSLLPVMDRVVYVAHGRVTSGTTDEVVRSDVLSSLYGHHVDVLRVHGRVLVVASSSDESAHLVSEHPELVIE